MTRLVIPLFILCLVSSVPAQDLKTTLQWMKNTSAHHVYSDAVQTGTLHWSSGHPTLCDVQITLDEKGRDTAYAATRTFTFSLKDVDPKTITPEPNAYKVASVQQNIYFEMKDELPKIACDKASQKTLGGGKDCPKRDFSFDFQEASYAWRFANAMRSAVKACGGRASAF